MASLGCNRFNSVNVIKILILLYDPVSLAMFSNIISLDSNYTWISRYAVVTEFYPPIKIKKQSITQIESAGKK